MWKITYIFLRLNSIINHECRSNMNVFLITRNETYSGFTELCTDLAASDCQLSCDWSSEAHDTNQRFQ